MRHTLMGQIPSYVCEGPNSVLCVIGLILSYVWLD